jgi:hypothetical protein
VEVFQRIGQRFLEHTVHVHVGLSTSLVLERIARSRVDDELSSPRDACSMTHVAVPLPWYSGSPPAGSTSRWDRQPRQSAGHCTCGGNLPTTRVTAEAVQVSRRRVPDEADDVRDSSSLCFLTNSTKSSYVPLGHVRPSSRRRADATGDTSRLSWSSMTERLRETPDLGQCGQSSPSSSAPLSVHPREKHIRLRRVSAVFPS